MNKPSLTPEQKAALEKVQAKYRTPEKRAEHEQVRKDVRTEFPPKPTSNPIVPNQSPGKK